MRTPEGVAGRPHLKTKQLATVRSVARTENISDFASSRKLLIRFRGREFGYSRSAAAISLKKITVLLRVKHKFLAHTKALGRTRKQREVTIKNRPYDNRDKVQLHRQSHSQHGLQPWQPTNLQRRHLHHDEDFLRQPLRPGSLQRSLIFTPAPSLGPKTRTANAAKVLS